MINTLPIFLKGNVCKGYGRGSKELGIPTANLDDDVLQLLPSESTNGIYFGWAQVDSSPVYKMVMSIGWNPFYKNTKRSVEVHILHIFEEDFYGSTVRVIVEGFLRNEQDFSSKEEMINQIKMDISIAEKKLLEKNFMEHLNYSFFLPSVNIEHQIENSEITEKSNVNGFTNFVQSNI
ncbi:hypothetical protein PGB90_000312 [Kerria lacca]